MFKKCKYITYVFQQHFSGAHCLSLPVHTVLHWLLKVKKTYRNLQYQDIWACPYTKDCFEVIYTDILLFWKKGKMNEVKGFFSSSQSTLEMQKYTCDKLSLMFLTPRKMPFLSICTREIQRNRVDFVFHCC